MRVQVVENPRRRRRGRGRRRGTLTAKQLAAGFGGKGRMSGGSSRGRKSRRRSVRNPFLGVVNPRRSRRSRNPGLLGGLGSFGGFDLESALYVGVGAIVPKYLLGFAAARMPMIPTTGMVGYAVRGVAVWVTAFGAGKLLKSQKAKSMIMAGGLGMIMVDLFKDYVAPRLGITGLGEYVPYEALPQTAGSYAGAGNFDPALYG